jgi:plastocyanin
MRSTLDAMGRRGSHRLSVALALAALAAVITPSGGSSASAEDAVAHDNTVKIDNFTFNPERPVVPPGTTVAWINKDDIPHNVVSVKRLFKSKALDTDDRFSFAFATPGAYEYFCSLHPHMKATIIVEDQKK